MARMGMRVFVTGGSGFVGWHVVRELLRREYGVNALVHRKIVRADRETIREIPGDLFNPSSLDSGIRGSEAVIHLVGIIDEKPAEGVTFQRIHVDGTRSVVDAARRNGVKRFIHMSASGTRENAVSEYHRTKWQAEQYVRASGLDWTIFRPGFIHGKGGFMLQEASWARKKAMPFFAMPYFGAGLLGLRASGSIEPVCALDVSRAFVDAIDKPQTIGKTYDLVGPNRMTWPEFHRAASTQIVGKRRLTAPVPAWFALLLANAGLGPLLGFNPDQVIMSQEAPASDMAPFEQDFGWKPNSFESTLALYASKL